MFRRDSIDVTYSANYDPYVYVHPSLKHRRITTDPSFTNIISVYIIYEFRTKRIPRDHNRFFLRLNLLSEGRRNRGGMKMAGRDRFFFFFFNDPLCRDYLNTEEQIIVNSSNTLCRLTISMSRKQKWYASNIKTTISNINYKHMRKRNHWSFLFFLSFNDTPKLIISLSDNTRVDALSLLELIVNLLLTIQCDLR